MFSFSKSPYNANVKEVVMKKILSVLGLLSLLVFSAQASNAFDWGYLNPANWGNSSCCEKSMCKRNKCDKKVDKCVPKCEQEPPCPCPAAPPVPCDACDTLQNQMQYRNSIK